MAGETYYYFFSLVLVLGIALYIINLVCLRISGRTTFGLTYKPGTPEYKRVVKLARTRNLVITAIILGVFIGNLINSIVRVTQLNTPDAHFVAVFAPISTVVLFVLIIFTLRWQLNHYQ